MPADKRWRHKGRSGGPSFVSIPHFILDSEQWAALPASSVKLIMELARQFKGNNNGDLAVTATMLRDRGWPSEPTIWKHLHLLEERQWIVRTRRGGRHIGCNLYAITWWPIDECGGKHHAVAERKASHAWKNNIGTAENEVRNLQKVKCEPVGLQKVKREPVRMRPAA